MLYVLALAFLTTYAIPYVGPRGNAGHLRHIVTRADVGLVAEDRVHVVVDHGRRSEMHAVPSSDSGVHVRSEARACAHAERGRAGTTLPHSSLSAHKEASQLAMPRDFDCMASRNVPNG